jgi:hypothetical protein
VQVTGSTGGDCNIRLFDVSNGDELDNATMRQGPGKRTLDPSGRQTGSLALCAHRPGRPLAGGADTVSRRR